MRRKLLRTGLLLLPLSLLPTAGARANGPPTVTASGHATFFTSFGGEPRLFKFHAKEVDGDATGKATLVRPESGVKLQVEIDCIIIVDSATLLLGGTITESTSGNEGYEVVFAVRDGGKHGADRLSPLFEATCETDDWALDSLRVIDAGQIKVHVKDE